MKKIRICLLTALTLLLFTSCGALHNAKIKRYNRICKDYCKDSVIVEKERYDSVIYVQKDSIFFVPPDSAWIIGKIECDSLNNVLMKEIITIKGTKTKPTIVVHKDGTFIVNCNVDSVAIFHTYYEKFEKSGKIEKIKEIRTVTVEKPLNKKLLWYSIILTIIVILYVIYKVYLYRRLKNLQKIADAVRTGLQAGLDSAKEHLKDGNLR